MKFKDLPVGQTFRIVVYDGSHFDAVSGEVFQKIKPYYFPGRDIEYNAVSNSDDSMCSIRENQIVMLTQAETDTRG